MALPDGTHTSGAAGTLFPTELVNGTEFPVGMQADASGHIIGTLPTYLYATPSVAVGASKLYFDLFNATGSGKILDLRGLWCIPDTDVAVVGAVGVRMDLYRTSAVGTGGTVNATGSATPDIAGGNITTMDTSNAALPVQVTARWLPTAGATIDDWMFPSYIPTEETHTSMSYLTQYQNLLPYLMWGQQFAIRENQGVLMKQGTVAGVGNVHFLLAFTAE